jgi:RNA polymerase sigma-70 factor (ECF subfamily)
MAVHVEPRKRARSRISVSARASEGSTDEMLLAGFGTGDPVTSLAFVQRFQRAVFGAALAVIGDLGIAEDIAQECFVRAWRHAAGYDPRRGTVRSWLVAIARNLAVDTLRVRRPCPHKQQDLELFITTNTDTPETHALAREHSTQLRRVLSGLPATQARAVVLTAVYGLTAAELAEIEQIPLGTAKSRIRAALAKLHDTVSESSDP